MNFGNGDNSLLQVLDCLPGNVIQCGRILELEDFILNPAQGLQKKLADVSGDCGVARRDAAGVEEDQEFSQDVIHGSSGAEVVDGAEEFESDGLGIVGFAELFVLLPLDAGMVGAE